MPRPVKHHRADRGVTLVELVVAVAILAIASVAAFRSFDAARDGIGGQLPRLFAQQVALNRAAELRLTGLEAGRDLPDTVQMGHIDWHVALTERGTSGALIETEIHVSATDQPGARFVVYVPPTARQGAQP